MLSFKTKFNIVLLLLLVSACKVNKISTNSFHATESNLVKKIIENARKYTGVPYLYGGNDAKGIDCSGLICNVFKEEKILLPRVSFQQAEFFPQNDIKFIQKGDLVFFVTSGENISHAGIVTEVKNENEIMFIHASTSKGVREDNLKLNYWWNRFARVCRPKI